MRGSSLDVRVSFKKKNKRESRRATIRHAERSVGISFDAVAYADETPTLHYVSLGVT